MWKETKLCLNEKEVGTFKRLANLPLYPLEKAPTKKRERALQKASCSEAIDVFDKLGIYYVLHKDGTHIRLRCGREKIDFWPGRGKWVSKKGAGGVGLKSLLTYFLLQAAAHHKCLKVRLEAK